MYKYIFINGKWLRISQYAVKYILKKKKLKYKYFSITIIYKNKITLN